MLCSQQCDRNIDRQSNWGQDKNKYIDFWYSNTAVKTKWFRMHQLKQDKNNIIYNLFCLYREADGVSGF